MNWLFKTAMLLFWLSLPSVAHGADDQMPATPLDVSVCGLLRDPAAYNPKRVKVTGDVSRGFEDFTLSPMAYVRKPAVRYGLSWVGVSGPG